MATIRPRPQKGDRPDRPTHWQITWSLPPGPDGKQRREYESFEGTKGEAQRRAREHQTEIDARGKAAAAPSRRTVGDYMPEWLEEYGTRRGLQPKTYASYLQQVRLYIEPRLGAVPLRDLTPDRIARWMAEVASGESPLSPRSVAYARAVLRMALKDAVRRGLIPTNPVEQTEPPPQNPKQVHAFTLEEVRRLDAQAATHRLGPMLSLAWQTGLRQGELLALRWEDVDLDAGIIRVRQARSEVPASLSRSGEHEVHIKPPKSRKSVREWPLPPGAVRALRQRLADREEERRTFAGWQDTGLVFTTRNGKALSARNVTDDYYALRDAAGLPRYGFHSLRHTAATLALQADVGIAQISSMLGHASVAITGDTYAHVIGPTKRAAADRFAAFLEAAPTDAKTGAKTQQNQP